MPRFPDKSDKRALAKFSDEKWRSYDNFYRWASQRWKRSLEFIRGQHWRVLETLDIDKIPAWKRYPVIGLTLGMYSDQFAQWLESSVRWSAQPISGDYEDIYRAELAEQVLKYAWELTESDNRKIDLGAWLLAAGCATMGVFWDTDTGNLTPLGVEDPETGEIIPVDPRTGQPDPSMSEPVLVDAGELGIEVVSPEFARWGQKAKEGVMIGRLDTFDDVVDKYGEEVANSLKYSNRDPQLDLSWVGMPSLRPTEDQRTLIVRHQVPRSFRHPGGLWWESSGDVLLAGPYDLPGKRLSYVPFRWVPVPGYHAFGISPLYEVTFSNKAKNELRGKQQEWMNRVVPKTLLMNGGGIPAGKMTDEPGQEVPGVNPGGKPEFLDPPAFPSALTQMDQDATEDALFVAQYRFSRREKQPPGTSTRPTRRPQPVEGGEMKLAHLATEPSWQELGRVLLSFVGKYYTDERTVTIMGPDRGYQLVAFKGTDLANLANSIKISKLPIRPWNRQALRDNVVSLLQTEAGRIFFQDEDGQIDRDRLQQASEAVGLDVAFSTLDPDVNEARNEIDMARAGIVVEYSPHQNSEIHLVEKLRTVKSMAYKGWPEQSREILQNNIEQHQDALQDQQQAEKQAMFEQELALRTIRMETEAQGKTREVLAEMLVKALGDVLTPPKKDKE